jgi:hypothetical protein
MIVSLSNARGLGLLPEMSVEYDGIYITRWDEDCIGLPLYSFRPRHYTPGLLEGLARYILDQGLVGDEFLIKNGFQREYGASASIRKTVPINLRTPPVPRSKGGTPIRRVARAIFKEGRSIVAQLARGRRIV